MHTTDAKRKFFSSSIVGGNCAIATGVAYAIKLKDGKEWVHIFCGDACLDEGSFWEALRFSQAQNLNITFIVENNDRSVCTSIKDRWGKKDAWVDKLKNESKIYYYKYVPIYPHVGTGKQITFM